MTGEGAGGSGVDCLLVGDSASNVMCGHLTTLPMTLDPGPAPLPPPPARLS